MFLIKEKKFEKKLFKTLAKNGIFLLKARDQYDYKSSNIGNFPIKR